MHQLTYQPKILTSLNWNSRANQFLENEKYLLSHSKDIVNGEVQEHENPEYLMKHKTNLPSTVRLQVGCWVMFLINKYIDKQICNGTIGIVTDINKEQEIARVAFRINRGIIDVEIHLDWAGTF